MTNADERRPIAGRTDHCRLRVCTDGVLVRAIDTTHDDWHGCNVGQGSGGKRPRLANVA